MKKIALIFILAITLLFARAMGQQSSDYSKIDLMLIRGDYNKVVDTCRLILTTDSLNPEIYYKMGLAYQNFLPDDKSFDCFMQAASLAPDNNMYKFMVAKGYYNKGKYNQARPLLENLCEGDSMNWEYSYYLTSLYMQRGKYQESLNIYKRFYMKDSTDYIILDRIGFANLRMKKFYDAIELYNRSLALKENNTNALKNLSFLYASTKRVDTALQLLTRGIEIDPTDMDLYVRRAALNFSRNYTKRAMDDYLKILASGDSSFLNLKRTGIGYSNNLQPKKAIDYLLLAYQEDSSDFEVARYLAQDYNKINNLKKSAYYYRRIIKNLNPAVQQLNITYIFLAEVLKSDGLYKEAITAYLNGQEIRDDPNITMIVANLYDEKLNDIPNAIHYYQLFLDKIKEPVRFFQQDYIESIRKRLEYLKEKQPGVKI